MDVDRRRIPPGPAEPFDPSSNLLNWLLANFEKFGDVFKASVHLGPIYAIRDPRHAQHVLQRNWQNYRKGLENKRVELLVGRGLFSSEGEAWKSQRQLIQPSFHHHVIANTTLTIADATAELLRKWERAAHRNEAVNVTHDVSLMVLELVLALIFGNDVRHAAPAFAILATETTRDLQFAQNFRPLRQVVAGVVAQRRAEQRTGGDFLGMFMQARGRDDGAAMSDAQLVTEIMTLVVAGHETTAQALSLCWYLLSQHPDVEERLANEAVCQGKVAGPTGGTTASGGYVAQVISETLRLFPPGWLITRKALDDDMLDDYFVPAKTEIYISPYIIQRHPGLWQEPDRFDPGRFDADRVSDRHKLAMLPFSAGPRTCIGENLARLEMQMHLTIIARRLRLRCTNPLPLDLELGVNLRNRDDFIMRPEFRSAAA